MSVLTRKITMAALVAALIGGTLALPSSSGASPVAHASKCKKGKKGKRKKKKCKGAGQSGGGVPGQATHPHVTPPTQTPTPAVSDVVVASNPVLGGDSTSGQVTISSAASNGGQAVTLQSSDPTRAGMPASVVVPAGQTSASFPVSTSAGSSVTVTLTASIAASSDSTQLNVVSDPSVISVSLQRQCFTTGSYDTNRVTLDVPAPTDTAVQLSSDNPLSFSVPASTTVPSGSKTALFTGLAVDPDPAVTVTATLGSSQATDTALVGSLAPTPAAASVSLQPNSVTVGGGSTGTVTLDCEAPAGGTVVYLSSDLPGVASPTQASVTVPQDQLSTTFQVTTSSTGTAHISVNTGTGGPQQAALDVNSLGT